jgi:ketosteroid isomerase-like protein
VALRVRRRHVRPGAHRGMQPAERAGARAGLIQVEGRLGLSSSNDPMAAVRQYVDAFNNGDEKAMAALCADPMQILDGMSPHVWQGATAAQDWWRDALVEGEHLGVSGYHIGLGEPRHVDVTGDYAYVVVPTTFDYNRQGKLVSQTGASFTVALRKVDGNWRLTAWAWTKGRR